MNEYPSVDDQQAFTPAQKAAFLGSAMCIATGSKTQNGAKVTANIPLTDITPVVPTKLSDLTDDITVDTYNSTSEAPISGKGVASALANFGGFIVTTIENGKPKVDGTPDQKKIYLTPTGESGTENAYDEWICTDATVPTWEKVGVTRVDLSQYYTKSEADSAFVSKTGYVATENNYTTTEKTKLDGIETGAEVNTINSISIDNTELEPDGNKNVNIGFSGSWLTTDENNNIYVSPSYGGGTGGLNCNSDYDLSVAVDKSTIGIYHTEGGTLHVICDNDTIYDTNSGIGVLYDTDTITTKNGNGLEVANPVPSTDNINNGYLLTKTANGIQWNELDRTNIVRAGAGIEVYGTAGYPERVSVINPVPTPSAAHADVGKVLTVQQSSTPSNPDEIVWASLLPAIPADFASKKYVLSVDTTTGLPTWCDTSGAPTEAY